MDDAIQTFVQKYRRAAMITTRRNGQAHVARCGLGVVAGKLWSSGTETRVRTRNLKRDPRATLFVWADDRKWLAVEARVAMITGPEGWAKTLDYWRATGRPPEDEAAFLSRMEEEGRLIYEFEITRAYGDYA